MPDADLLRWLRRTRGRPVGAEVGDVGRPARHPDLARVTRELARLGIHDRFRFLWSGDGSGVEEDDPRVIQIHRPLTRAAGAPAWVRAAAERMISMDIASVARHEVGHALLFQRPRAARSRAFRALFGHVDRAYRVGDPLGEVLRRVRRHGGLANPRYRRVVSLYAATHPHERFAEAVRIALQHHGDEAALAAWAARHGTAAIVTDQLLWAARWLRGEAG